MKFIVFLSVMYQFLLAAMLLWGFVSGELKGHYGTGSVITACLFIGLGLTALPCFIVSWTEESP